MEEPRVKLIEKAQKKIDKMIDELKLLQDAQTYIMVNTGEDQGVVQQIRLAVRSLGQASYELLLAQASAEGEEIVGQIKHDLDKFEEAVQ